MLKFFPVVKRLLLIIPCSLHADATSSEHLEIIDLRPVVVTSVSEQMPLVVELDMGAAIQPIPAQDGADILKHVPGFAVIRKGGIDGDPVLRGAAGSRLSISVDGESILGGCGQRMDPPTAYVFPSSFDRVVITKGPQTVRFGPGNTAGVVRFERDLPSSGEAPGWSADAYATAGSFGRLDLGGTFQWKQDSLTARVVGSSARSDDYESGAGESVHSSYERWNAGAAVGWLFQEGGFLELTANTSDGEAAYADRMMDGSKFARDNMGLRYAVSRDEGMLRAVEARLYYNDVDHVMDNYSLRTFTPSMMMPRPTVSNPGRLTYGGKFEMDAEWSSGVGMSLGFDFQVNAHSVRSTSDQEVMPYERKARIDDANVEQWGLYVESSMLLTERLRWVWGARVDGYSAKDQRDKISVTMLGERDNPTSGATRSETLPSGFLRLEHSLSEGWGQWYAGVGYVSRFPDYWELFSKESRDSLSAFETDPEHILQMDVGWIVEREFWSLSVSGFAASHEDYILIESGFAKPGMMGNSRMAVISRNIEASTYGLESSLRLRWENGLFSAATLAWVRGENESDGHALAQIPPLEGTLEVGYRGARVSGAVLVRLVDEQDRIAVNQGNIVGQDIGPSDGFAVASLHASYRLGSGITLAAGVDNLFDKDYAEHLSRAGGTVAGYVQTTRVHEPGRVVWVRADLNF